jgi:four helix bundle protein
MTNPRATAESSNDPLERMTVNKLATALVPDCFEDCEKLVAHPVTVEVGPQLYKAVGSIIVNVAEGYSRTSGADRVRFYEYALGSVRESMKWYRSGEPVLGTECATNRLDRLEEMRRLLLATIPRERGRTIRKVRT